MKETNLLERLAPVGVVAFGALAFTGMIVKPTQAASFEKFSALAWENGTSQFYDAANAALDAGEGGAIGQVFSVEYCLLNPDCEATISNDDGEFDIYFDPLEIVSLASTPTATWEYTQDLFNEPGFVTFGEFQLIGSDLKFEFESNEVPGAIVRAILPVDSKIEGGRKNDGAIEFFLETGEWKFEITDTDGSTILKEDIANRSTFGKEITSNLVTSGTYEAEGEVRVNVPESSFILGILTIGGLGLGLKRKK